jgi:hypothetical protein
VPYECGKVAAALLENLFSDLLNLVHDWITHFSFSQQLLGRTDNRTSVSSVDTRPLQLLYDLGIVDMGAVPCQEMVHTVYRGDGHVERICTCRLRYAPGVETGDAARFCNQNANGV